MDEGNFRFAVLPHQSQSFFVSFMCIETGANACKEWKTIEHRQVLAGGAREGVFNEITEHAKFLGEDKIISGLP